MQFNTKLGQAACLTAIVFVLPSLTYAQDFPIEKTSNHSMGSAPDVWRVELRQPNQYLTTSSGDRDGISELQKLAVRLEGGEGQFHAFDEAVPFMSLQANDTTNDYVAVQAGSMLHLTRLTIRNRNGYNLWIHVREQTRIRRRQPFLSFRIRVRSRELDCSGRRACRRGDNGEIVYSVRLQPPAVRSSRCIPENTYQVSVADGATMMLQPNSRGLATPSIGQRNHDDGPHMALQMGEICIASTSR